MSFLWAQLFPMLRLEIRSDVRSDILRNLRQPCPKSAVELAYIQKKLFKKTCHEDNLDYESCRTEEGRMEEPELHEHKTYSR
jgi:hypothetical protein